MSILKSRITYSVRNEYKEKEEIKRKVLKERFSSVDEMGLKSFSRIARYMIGLNDYIDRGLIYAHLDFEPITTLIAKGESFTVVSGKNPSTGLHLGHLATFKMLLGFQNLGAEVVIPLSSDESYVDGKVGSLIEAEKIARRVIIPQLIAIGFDSDRTKVIMETEYKDMYRLSCTFGQYVSMGQLNSVFGKESLLTASQVFYRGSVQLSTILLPQLKEFGGMKCVLVPVSADQHPYVLLARDVANKLKLTPPSEVVIPFLQSYRDPFSKMSSSRPDSCIFLDDSPEVVRKKLSSAYTGSVSTLEGHREFGAIAEIDSCFQILLYHHPSYDFVKEIYRKYSNGLITSSEIKLITIDFVNKMLEEIQNKVVKVTEEEVDSYILSRGITSI